MRRKSYTSYLFLIATLFVCLSLPDQMTDRMRACAVGCLSPSWSVLFQLKNTVLRLAAFVPTGLMTGLNSPVPQEESTRRDIGAHFLPAQVIFRDPASWSSFLWLNVGERDNQKAGVKIICKNSPVILGTSIVGVVEVVEYTKCRVRLISDAHLVPSVRAVRGTAQNRLLLQHLEQFLSHVELRGDLFNSEQEALQLVNALNRLKHTLDIQGPDYYLAKGELFGTSTPLWRSRSVVLKGAGFNFEVSDEKGFARDLRSGAVIGLSNLKEAAMPILKSGDLLITTGMDGIFPEGFHVAIVSAVAPLREGAAAYELEAYPTAGNLNEIQHVVVLPPIP